jgi:hypothetical protein
LILPGTLEPQSCCALPLCADPLFANVQQWICTGGLFAFAIGPRSLAATATEPRGESTNSRLSQRPGLFSRLSNGVWLTRSAFAFVVLLGLFHLFLSRRPLWHTDLWGHLAYGRVIVTNRAIPTTEPLMPLSRGMPFDDLAWLSEVLGYLPFQWKGVAAIQFLYATSITTCLGLLAFRIVQKTHAVWFALLGIIACAWLEWQQFLIVRPQLAGLVCFVCLFLELTRQRLGRESLFLIPGLFALWANLHGSFVLGFGLIAAFAAGREADLLRTRAVNAVWRDLRFRWLLLLFGLGFVGTLLNPYGWGIFRAAWETAGNPNFADLVEWQPLSLQMRQGQAAMVVSIALIAAWCFTPRRIAAAELILLLGFGVAMLRNSRMIVWWAPIAAYFLAIHSAAVWKRFHRFRLLSRPTSTHPTRPFWTFASLLTVCVITACSPLGQAVILGKEPSPRASLSPETPVGATAYLRAHPPHGQIFNTYEWGDYLLWAGPEGLQVFVASHAHLVPREVWLDYLRVISLQDGWERILDRYQTQVAVLDSIQHGDLVDSLRDSKNWSLVYEDDRSAVFVRRYGRAEIGGQKKSSGPLHM